MGAKANWLSVCKENPLRVIEYIANIARQKITDMKYLESERLLRGKCHVHALFLLFCGHQEWSLLVTELDPPLAKCLINSELENIWGKGGSAKSK